MSDNLSALEILTVGMSASNAAWALDALQHNGLAVVKVGELERYKAALFLACRGGWGDPDAPFTDYLAKADAWLLDQEATDD